jgi:CRP-like cAMP-binding protein
VEAVLGDARVVSFKGEAIRELMAGYPVFAMNLTREVGWKLQNLQNLMVNMG